MLPLSQLNKLSIAQLWLNEAEFCNITKQQFISIFQIDDPKNINHIAQNVPVCTAKDYAEEVVKFCR